MGTSGSAGARADPSSGFGRSQTVQGGKKLRETRRPRTPRREWWFRPRRPAPPPRAPWRCGGRPADRFWRRAVSRRTRPSTRRPSGNSSTLRAHLAQPFGQRRDAVALLHAQFLGIVNLDSFLGERPERRQHGQLVDHFRHLRARDCAAFERSVAHRNVARQVRHRAIESST